MREDGAVQRSTGTGNGIIVQYSIIVLSSLVKLTAYRYILGEKHNKNIKKLYLHEKVEIASTSLKEGRLWLKII